MIEVTVEVAKSGVRRRVAVQAESITLALEIAGRQNPGCEVGVTFPCRVTSRRRTFQFPVLMT